MAADTAVELSIVIPTYNRAEQLRACLEALSHQTQPATDFEVIVVVDGSTDGTREMLADLTTAYRLRVIWQENSGQGAARNRGVDAAIGRYCLFLDDDITADHRLVAEHLRVQRECQGVVGIGQITLTLSPKADWFARCFAQAWRRQYEQLTMCVRPPSWKDCYSGNLSVPRAALLEVGGFAVDLGRCEDIELAYRLERHGLPPVYISTAIADQNECKGLRELTADAEKAGVAAVEMYRRHPSTLPQLLGTFCEVRVREILLCHILLALNLSAPLLAVIGPLFMRRSWVYTWYRLLYSYCYWRGVRQALGDRDKWRRLTHGTPILMYHALGESGQSASRYVIPVRSFARQMACLKWLGYQVLSLEEFLRYRHEYGLPPARSVVITIDDGYADSKTLAYPILRRYRFPATIFLVSDHVGSTNQWDSDGALAGRPLLSWSDIREMLRGGVQVGAHTRTHPALPTLPARLIEDEVEGSRREIEHQLKVPARVFAYTYGEYDSLSQTMVEQAGFLGSCGTQSGMNTPKTPRYALRRIEIYGTDSLFRFLVTVKFGNAEVIMRRGKR